MRSRVLSAPGLQPLLAELPGALLAGAEYNLPPAPGFAQSFVFHASRQVDEQPGVRASITAPGFETTEADFAVRSFAAGIARVNVELSPAATGLAPLRIEFLSGAEPATAELVPEGAVVIARSGGGADRYAMPADATPVVSFDVPVGPARVCFVSRDGGFCHPAEHEPAAEIDVGSAGEAFSVPVRQLGAIRFEPASGAGQKTLLVELSRGAPERTVGEMTVKGRTFPAGSNLMRSGEHHVIPGGAGVIRGLAPGTYHLSAASRCERALELRSDGLIEISANAVEVVRVLAR